MPGPDPYSTGLAAAGALGNFLTGRSAAKAQKELLRTQKGLLNMQAQTYKQAQPTYQQLLAQGGAYAGLGQHQLPPTAGHLGSAYGTPEDQYRFAAMQDQINHQQQAQGNQLQAALARRGIASSSIGAALAHNQASAQRDLAGFQRQLAIEAPHEMERRRAALANLLNPAFGQGAAASSGYGQQAAQYGQQANQAYGGLGDILQNWQQQNALQHYMNLYGVNPGGGGNGSGYSPPPPTPLPAYDPYNLNWGNRNF